MPSLRAQAQKQDRMLRSIESLGDPFIKQYAKAFQDRALRALKNGGKVKLSKADEEKIVNEMADLMLLGFVKRYQAEKTNSGVDLNLSFSRNIRKIARQFSLDLDGIRSSFLELIRPKVRSSVDLMSIRINTSLTAITAKQQPTAIAARQLRRRFVEMGLSPRNPVLAETLVRTHAQIAFAAGQYQLEQDDPYDVIWGYTYVTVGDVRVRDSHDDFDGLTRPKNDPIWKTLWPPNGWNCRCQLLTLTEEPDYISPKPKLFIPDAGFDFSIGRLLAA